MATRDLTYLIDFNVEGSEELSTAATNMETLADATTGVDESAALNIELPPAEDIEALGDLGADGGALDQASGKADLFTGALGQMVTAIGLINIASFAADQVMEKFQERQEKLATIDAFDDAQIKAFAEAIREAGDDVTALVDALEGTQRITGIEPLSGQIVDITNDLAQAGVTADEWFFALENGGLRSGTFIDSLEAQGVAQESLDRIQVVAIDSVNNYDAAQRNATASNTVFTESQVSANQALQELLNNQDPMRGFTDEWDLLKESMSDGSIDTTAAANALNTLKNELGLTTEQVLELAQADLDEAAEGALAFADALNSIDFQTTDIEGATTAFSAYTDQLFAAANEAETREAAFDALSAAAEGQALTFSAATEAGRAQSDALEAVARVIDEDLADAYDNANGSQEAFVTAATEIANETLGRLQTELGLTDDQLQTVAAALGLTEGDFIARYQLAGAEEARLQLELLGGAIEGLPPSIEQQVNLLITQGDYVAARDLVAQYYVDNPIVYETDVDPSGATDAMNAVVLPQNVPTATIPADADTIQAAADLLAAASEPRTALIVAVANNQAAAAALTSLVELERTAVVDVATGSIDMPSNTELRNQIGTVRVPIQLYYNGRVEGNRPI